MNDYFRIREECQEQNQDTELDVYNVYKNWKDFKSGKSNNHK